MRTGQGILAAVILFLGILAFPLGNDILSPAASLTAAVAALMVTLWVTEAIPLEATALVPLVAFPLLGILTVQQSAAPYADPVDLPVPWFYHSPCDGTMESAPADSPAYYPHCRNLTPPPDPGIYDRNGIYLDVDFQYRDRDDDGSDSNCNR